jgi:hypothetical protein
MLIRRVFPLINQTPYVEIQAFPLSVRETSPIVEQTRDVESPRDKSDRKGVALGTLLILIQHILGINPFPKRLKSMQQKKWKWKPESGNFLDARPSLPHYPISRSHRDTRLNQDPSSSSGLSPSRPPLSLPYLPCPHHLPLKTTAPPTPKNVPYPSDDSLNYHSS